MPARSIAGALALLLTFGAAELFTPLSAQRVPSPSEHLGLDIGADRVLADWDELLDYYGAVARTSPRVRLDTLGATTRGRPFVLLTITSGDNQERLASLRRIQERLSDPRTVDGPEELESLLDEGRAVVLLTHGIHSNEVGSALVAARLVHRLASSDAPEVRRILGEVVVLDIPSLNPDGTQWVTEWYRRWLDTEYEGAPLPWLYHHYVGHDNNRDWYAFTQVETRHAVEKVHNVWRPHIVHDIHQMGDAGARIFLPPYIEPWEPNVDPLITAAVNDLGTFAAARLHREGKRGVVVNAIYDAFAPARAYQHYHGGARILSETASARLATPDSLARSDLRGRRGYSARDRSWNHPWPWDGGRWGMPEIVDYMESAAMAVLAHAGRNRRDWLETAYRVHERAVEGWEEWPAAWIVPADEESETGVDYLLNVLRTGDVEVRPALEPFVVGSRRFPEGTLVVPMRQPFAGFAQALLEPRDYPATRRDGNGEPHRPYDVTAHTLSLLLGVEALPALDAPGVELGDPVPAPQVRFAPPGALAAEGAPRVGLYKSWQEPMEAGWTRWLFDRHELAYDTLHDERIRAGGLDDEYDVLVLQSQEPSSIARGWSAGRMPGPWAGGLGAEGGRSIREFVRSGGRVVAVENATDYVIDLFGLPVSNAVERLPEDEFYAPGSILRLVVPPGEAEARGVVPEVAAWYGRDSRAFAVDDPSLRVVARYGEGDPLLSGWILGPEHLSGRPALVEADVGRGSVVLFGFQPNYRGQSLATWPLLFDALTDRPLRAAGGDPEGVS